jgi:hypothetical protein
LRPRPSAGVSSLVAPAGQCRHPPHAGNLHPGARLDRAEGFSVEHELDPDVGVVRRPEATAPRPHRVAHAPRSAYGSEWHLLAAGAFAIMLVPLAVFFALQRYFVEGILAGSVK